MLGLNSMKDYLLHSRNFGASPGRCANRIVGDRFVLDGKTYELERNEPGGVNHIHGGSVGMARSLRTIRVPETGVLAIRYERFCDAPCPVNLCHRRYFNRAAASSDTGD